MRSDRAATVTGCLLMAKHGCHFRASNSILEERPEAAGVDAFWTSRRESPVRGQSQRLQTLRNLELLATITRVRYHFAQILEW